MDGDCKIFPARVSGEFPFAITKIVFIGDSGVEYGPLVNGDNVKAMGHFELGSAIDRSHRIAAGGIGW